MTKQKDWLSPPPVDCELLFDILRGYEQYRLVMSAVDLGIFSQLREPTEAQQVADRLHTNVQLTEKLLNCLVAVGLVRKQEKAYVNSRLSETYFVPDSSFSMMNLIQLIASGEKLWDNISSALKGESASKTENAPGKLEAVFDRSFVVAMAEGAIRGGLQATLNVLTQRPELKQAKRLLDLGGGHGLYGIGFASANPSLQVTIFDLPPIIKVARQYVERFQMQERINLVVGDFNKEDIGSGYNVVFASDSFYRPAHMLQPVLCKVRDSLCDGGLFVTKHWAMNPNRTSPITTVLWEFRLALGAYGHYVYDNDEYVELLRQTGFDSFELIDISTKAKPSSLILAKKQKGRSCMKMVTTQEVESIPTPEGVMRPLIFGKNTLLIHLEVPPGTEVPPHGHPSEGIVYCLEGKAELFTDITVAVLSPGCAAKVQAGESVGIRNPGSLPARLLLISAPPAASSVEELKAGIEAARSMRNGHQTAY